MPGRHTSHAEMLYDVRSRPARDEQLRRLLALAADSLDELADRADRSPKEPRRDGPVGTLTYGGDRLLECRNVEFR